MTVGPNFFFFFFFFRLFFFLLGCRNLNRIRSASEEFQLESYPKDKACFLIGVTDFGYFYYFSLFTGENLSCVSVVGVRGLVPQCHRGHSHVSLYEF